MAEPVSKICDRIFEITDELDEFVKKAKNGQPTEDEIQDAICKNQLVNRYLDRVTDDLPALIEEEGDEFLDRYETMFSKLVDTTTMVDATVRQIQQQQMHNVGSGEPQHPDGSRDFDTV